MLDKIFKHQIFENYEKKEYEVTTNHVVFGEKKIRGSIANFIDDENQIGIVIHKKNLFCYKDHKSYFVDCQFDRIIISDDMMKIVVKIN